MIHTAKQLKDKVKNMSGGNSEDAAAAVGVFNELLGVIILIVFAFIIWTKN